MLTPEEFRNGLSMLAQSYKEGGPYPDLEQFMLSLPTHIETAPFKELNEIHSAIEARSITDLSEDEYRLYLLFSAKLGIIKEDFLTASLDRLKELSAAREELPSFRLAASLIYIIATLSESSIPEDENFRDRLTRLPLMIILDAHLDTSQELGLLAKHFQKLPSWAIDSTTDEILFWLAIDATRNTPISALHASLLGGRFTPDQALRFHCGGYLDAISNWSSPDILEWPQARLLDASVCAVIVALKDGGGRDQDIESAARQATYRLRGLPARLRIELCNELLYAVIERQAPLNVVTLVWLQLAEWLAPTSGKKAIQSATALLAYAEKASEPVEATLQGRVEILISQLEYQAGDIATAAARAHRAVASCPDDQWVTVKAKVILTAATLDDPLRTDDSLAHVDTLLTDDSLAYADALGLYLLKARRLLECGDPAGTIAVTDQALALPIPDDTSKPSITIRRLRLLRAGARLKDGDGNGALSELLMTTCDLMDDILQTPLGVHEIDRRDWFAESEAILDRALQVALSTSFNGGHIQYENLTRLWSYVSSLRDVELVFHSFVREAWLDGDSSAAFYKATHDEMQRLDFSTNISISRNLDDFWTKYRMVDHASRQAEISMSLLPAFAEQLRERLNLDIEDIVSILEDREIFIEFAGYWTGLVDKNGAGTRALVAFVLHPHDGMVAFFGTRESEPSMDLLSAFVADLDIRPLHQISLPLRPEIMARTLAQVAEQYGAERLLVIPDGPLQEVSISALPLESGYLDDHLAVSLAVNTNDLRRTRFQHVRNPPVAVGCSPDMSTASSRSGDHLQFTSLTGPAAEAQLIASWNGAILMVDNVNHAKLARVVRPQFLHIAGHGYYMDPIDFVFSDPAWERGAHPLTFLSLPRLHSSRGTSVPVHSGLALGNVNEWLNSKDESQGVFTAYDLSWLDLRGTDAVVLSGCLTGVGPPERWRGLVDLRRAALTAGAANVIAAMQTVPDVATSLLMLLVYQLSPSSSWSENLRTAQRRIRSATVAQVKTWLDEWGLTPPEFGGRYLSEILAKPADTRPFENPRFWAGIVCYTTRNSRSSAKGIV